MAQFKRPLVINGRCFEKLRTITKFGPNKTDGITFDEFPRWDHQVSTP